MNSTLRLLTILALLIATATAVGQEPPLPTGNWQSSTTATYSNPAMTGAELFLSINVSKDGSFKGVWGQYLCNAYPTGNGVSIFSCSRYGNRNVSGRFGPGRQGAINLEHLGRSTFTWTTSGTNELALELPKNWQGADPILYGARLTRDGKSKSATGAGPASDEVPILSAVALYREFKQNEKAALERHGGKTLVLEGRRGTLISLSGGGAAVHVPDGFTSRALVLYFPDVESVSEIAEGAQFRFRCTVSNFDYQYVQMEKCSIVR